MNIVIYLLNGVIFKKISYININNLKEILNKILIEYNCDSFIQLILNNTILNEGNKDNNFDFYTINNLNRELENHEFIQIIFILKSTIFIENKDNIFIFNEKYNNDLYYKLIYNYSKLEKDWYNIIINNSYRNFILLCIKSYQLPIYNYISNCMKNDIEIILALASSRGIKQGCGYEIDFPNFPDKFKNDKNIALAAINTYGSNLLYTSNRIKNNKELVLTAINSEPYALKYASNNLKNDRHIILSAVKQDGNLLIYASKKLKNDKEIVLVAIKQNPLSLIYASDSLKNDKEFMLNIVKQNGLALEYASIKLKNNKEIVLAAIKQNGFAEDFINKNLKSDKDIKAILDIFNDNLYYESNNF